MAVGAAAVVLTSAIGLGAQREVSRSIETMGTNLLVVRPATVRRLVARRTVRGVVSTLVPDDAAAVAALPCVMEAAPGVDGAVRVKAASQATLTKVQGTTAAFLRVRRFRVAEGRFLDDDDDRTARRVAVLGSRVAEALFPGESAVGREIRLRGAPFEVIGVLESKGSVADGADEDSQVVVPLRTAMRRVLNTTWLNAVFVSVRDPLRMTDAESAIVGLLRARHRVPRDGEPDDFAVQNVARFLAIQRDAAGSLGLATTLLGAIALLVGGTGILALMLLSVKERTGEIGLRMAIGARPRDIFVQFLVEAVALAVSGWVLGAVLGGLAASAVALGTNWSVAVPPAALGASLALAVTIGLGFGAIPARRASVLPPIEALRSE